MGDGARALPYRISRPDVGGQRPYHPALVDTLVFIKPRVFRGDHRILELLGHLIQRHPLVAAQCVQQDRVAIRVVPVDPRGLTEDVVQLSWQLRHGCGEVVEHVKDSRASQKKQCRSAVNDPFEDTKQHITEPLFRVLLLIHCGSSRKSEWW